MSPAAARGLLSQRPRRIPWALLGLGLLGACLPVRADILRGGHAGGGSAPAAGEGGGRTGTTTPADTARARQNAQDALARTSNTLGAIRAMQQAAREAAEAGPNQLGPGLPQVRNGLGQGGLLRATGDSALWSGADLPEETIDTDGLINVGIRQTAQQALLDWQNFNIGKETRLHFDQSAAGAAASQWIAFNRVTDPSGNPSQILGQIQAEGQVYLINPNGTIFGGSSKVDLNTLTVSSLPINTNLIDRGLLNNPDSQFLFSGLELAAGPNGTPAFVPDPPPAATGRYGDIVIQAGALLETPVSADGNGGRILLVAPNVTNHGSIHTPAGQTILAAGLQAGFAAHDTADPSLRGLDVFIGQTGGSDGIATNTGLISAPRGNITVAGRELQVQGALAATTSTTLNGRIDLRAHHDAISNPAIGASGLAAVPFLHRQAGSITIGDEALLSVLPEYGTTETAIGTSLALRSQVNLEGGRIRFGSGSTLFAPNAQVRVAAGDWFFTGGATPISRFLQSAGTIDIGENALLNVAGSIEVDVSVAQNIIEVDLRGAELANSPLQRNGPLRGATIQVDLRSAGVYLGRPWIGTPLADVSGFANLIQRDISQLTTAGGSIMLSAGESATIRPGAVIDVSGGSIAWQDAVVNTTWLMAGGRLYDISEATPDIVYDGIYTGFFDASNPRWGVSAAYQSPLAPGSQRLLHGYTEGAAGGALNITAPAMALDGELVGLTFPGEYQRDEAAAPGASSLVLNFTSISTEFASTPAIAPTPPEIVLGPGTPNAEAAGGSSLTLPLGLWSDSGFRSVTVNNPDGSITLPAGSDLQAHAYANLRFQASNIAINGSIDAPAGHLTFRSPNLTLDQVNLINNSTVTTNPLPDPARGNFTLAGGSSIRTSGLMVDDRVENPAAASLPKAIHGGSVTIEAFNATLEADSVIDVSGGALADARGRITHGDAGSIRIAGGRDLNVPSVLGGGLFAQGTLLGYSGATGGSLSLAAPAFQIGGTAPAGVIAIDPDFFNQNGFASFALTGTGLPTDTPGTFIPGVLVAENTEIAPVVESVLAVAPFGAPLQFLEPFVNEEGRRTPASVMLTATGVSSPFTSSILARGDLVLAAGSSIVTDAGGSVVLNGQATTVLGSIRSPGGSIRVSGASEFPTDGDPQLLTTLLIGPDAVLDASGKVVLVSDPLGLRTGTVWDGGEIVLSGNILAQQGARLLADGTSGILDLAPAAAALNGAPLGSLNGRLNTPVTVDSAGGTITLAGSSFLHSDATLSARAGGPSANGGSLVVSSSRFVPPNTGSTTADINLIVTSSPRVTSAANPSTVGTRPLDEAGNPVLGLGRISADAFTNRGFHNLTLAGNVRTEGTISLDLPGAVRLASGGILEVDGSLAVRAGYIHAGQDFRPPVPPGTLIEYFTANIPGVGQLPLNVVPTGGGGSVVLDAGMIDLGTLSFQNTGSATFRAPTGDIRGNGFVQAAGNLSFTAGQLHPTSGSPFGIFAYGGSSVTFDGGTLRPLPLSAGGTLSVHASSIVQNGTLRAPLGTINLGWDGAGTAPVNPVAGTLATTPTAGSLTLTATSVTSNSAIDPVTGEEVILPYGITFDGESWIDPAGFDITTTGPVTKDIKLAALNLTTEAGSTIDISGGGDLFAYRWVPGNGGTEDLLASEGLFAILPGYGFGAAPFAPFNPDGSALDGEPGYVNRNLRPGDQVTLAAGSAVEAGTYTLLPARYALLPGAFLVTPVGGTPVAAAPQPDGSTIVSGYLANNLSATRSGPTRITNFEIAPAETLAARAEYQAFGANSFFAAAARGREVQPPRLPQDAGILSFTATESMELAGGVTAEAAAAARRALIDINSSVDILINAAGTGGTPGTLVLSAELLNRFNADSLLIGGIRTQTADGISVATSTRRLTLDNGATTLVGNDLILTARESILIADNASIASSGSRPVGSIILGNAATPGSGNGVLVRVSGSGDAAVERFGVTPGGSPSLVVGRGASITGGAITLDSTAATSLASDAILSGKVFTLSSGEITVALDNPGTIEPTVGAVLDGAALDSLLANTTDLTLRSYSNLNFLGTGRVGAEGFESLALQAAAIRGLNQNGGTVELAARRISISNPGGGTVTAAPLAADGILALNADVISLARGDSLIDGFASTRLNAASELRVGSEGSLLTSHDLTIESPVLLGEQAANYRIAAGGALVLVGLAEEDEQAESSPGTGVSLELSGATVDLSGGIVLPSGRLAVRSTTGDLTIGGRVDLAGVSREFVDVTRHSSGGNLRLIAEQGSVRILDGASVDLSAPEAAGDAGRLDISAPNGGFQLAGELLGGAANGRAGAFTLDTASLPSLAALDAILNAGSFTSLRDFRVRNGDVALDGSATASIYRLAADQGDVIVSGTVDASGPRGGTIDLKAHGSLNLLAGSLLDASAAGFDAAGKGGAVILEAGAQRDGIIRGDALLSLQSGATILLGVDAGTASSNSFGQFAGTLHLRAPRNDANSDLAVAAIGADIRGASAITVEGYKLYDRTATGTLDNGLLGTIRNDADAYLGTANHNAMLARLTAANPALDLILMPGAEIINRSGGLTLGSSFSSTSADWNLATLRFGPRSAPGVLTLRAAGDLTLFNAISDGFNGGSSLWLAPLVAHNPLLPANSQSWSYRFTAGADLAAASHRSMVDAGSLASGQGSFLLGKNANSATATGGANATTASIIGNLYQVVRTGSGDIDIHAADSIRLLNPFASIYTAGTQVADPTGVFAPGDFVTPILNRNVSQVALGAAQQNYPAQYSMAGGNVTLLAGSDIERLTRNNSGLIADSSRQLPNNWLYRRGYLAEDGEFGRIRIGTGFSAATDAAASTTWWVDFSNFFQSVGALGGGNIEIIAGNDVRNTDAAIPTNARAPRGAPSAASLLELGGGDLRIVAGNDLSGGVYYLERGAGSLTAGGAVTTNSTRSPSFGLVGNLNNPQAATLDPQTWMPTALFVGKSSFDVQAGGDILLGPVANPFLLPQGTGNRFWYKTHFSTFSPDASLSAISLGGDVTFRNAVILPGQTQAIPMLRAWHETQLLFTGTSSSTAFSQPWLRLAESSLNPFEPVWSLTSPSLSLTSLSGNLNLAGNLTTFPSPSGQLELVAAGSIAALQPVGRSNFLIPGSPTRAWTSAIVNLSDADPRFVPSPLAPLNTGTPTDRGATHSSTTTEAFMSSLASMFFESGSYTGVNAALQTRQARHTRGGLHAPDADPVRIHALGGDLSGLTLFTGKPAWITAGRDITDIAFYLQNNDPANLSIVSASRNLTAANAASPLRVASLAPGNALSSGQAALPGDIQLAGPGRLQVIAGRDLDLGLGSSLPDGTGGGISTIGNLRNPYLTEQGASITVLAGINRAAELASSAIAVDTFLNELAATDEGLALIEEIQPGVELETLDARELADLSIEVFFRVLRDSGRDFNDPESPNAGTYAAGLAAIESLLGSESGNWQGEINPRGRDIRTRNGGDVRLLAPGGGLTLANTTLGNPLAPPGIITESGGNISIFTDQSVDIGIGRIFTLRGGDAIIWSSNGDIAAGSSSRTVQSAPPTRVIIDPQSAAVQTDLAGLATGGGIGVLATVEGIEPGDVDLIAPTGTIDAGDAGIRVTGNINLAAVQVTNAGNITAGGTSTGGGVSVGAPAVASVAAPPPPQPPQTTPETETNERAETGTEDPGKPAEPSSFTVEVIGYGGASDEADDDDDEDDEGDGEDGEDGEPPSEPSPPSGE